MLLPELALHIALGILAVQQLQAGGAGADWPEHQGSAMQAVPMRWKPTRS